MKRTYRKNRIGGRSSAGWRHELRQKFCYPRGAGKKANHSSSKFGRRYDAEFKENAVGLVLNGRTVTEVARDLGCSIWSLGRWVELHQAGQKQTQPQTVATETPEQRELRRLRQENDYLRRQRDILKKSLEHCLQPAPRRSFEIMHQLQNQFALTELVQVLEVSRSGFVAHEHREQRPRRQADQQIKSRLQVAFAQSRQTYGSPRLRIQLQRAGYRCGKNRLTRLMRELGLRPKQKRRFRPQTTQSDPRRSAADNWLAKVPAPSRPDQIWLSDITYIPTGEGWLYLAATLDACSRKCVGYFMDDCLETHLVTEAWERARQDRCPGPGLLHHSDRGVQYTSSRFERLLLESKTTPSMSRPGNPYDNALMESFFATLKTECFAGLTPATKAQAKLMVCDYIQAFYNPRRLHSALDYRSPVEFENQFN